MDFSLLMLFTKEYFIVNCHLFSGKELKDPRVLTDVGDVPVQEIRDCGVDDDRLMNVIGESVKLVMEEVWKIIIVFVYKFMQCTNPHFVFVHFSNSN